MDPKKITKKQSQQDESDVQLNHNGSEKIWALIKQSSFNDGTKIKWILKFHVLVTWQSNKWSESAIKNKSIRTV